MYVCCASLPHWPEIDFHEFQVYEPQNNASRAKLYIRRSDTEVGMVDANRLGGLMVGRGRHPLRMREVVMAGISGLFINFRVLLR